MTLTTSAGPRADRREEASEKLEALAAETIAKGSRSFAAAARLFDPATRRSAIFLYAWCRHCDDVIDGQTLGHREPAGGIDPARPFDDAPEPERLARLEAGSLAALAGRPGPEPAFRALAEVQRRHALPERLVIDHLDGYRMDVDGARFADLDDTLAYCYRVAGAVGVMMAWIMGVREAAVLDRACDLGIAFQLTNIARDIVEDAENGRCYLPESWLLEAGMTGGECADPARRPTVAALAARLVATAEPYYASAAEGLSALPARSAWAVATALGVYRAIGRGIMARGERAWDTRMATGRAAKFEHAGRGAALTLRSRRPSRFERSRDLWTRPSL